jgi:hypothetical protein
MRKIFFLPLLVFAFACNKTTVENIDLTKNGAVSNPYAADSTAKWTKNILPNFFPIVKKDYKDGKLSQEDC